MTDYEVVDLGGMVVTETTPVVAGPRGRSAYEVAVADGFSGTELEWLDSLQGIDGDDGLDGASAYEVAVENGFVGTEAEWLASLGGGPGGGAVDSVNGQVGAVVLDAADVGARPDTYVPAWDEVTGKPAIPASADDIGAETPAGAQAKVDTHAADTAGVHGIADTAALATTADVSTASTADRARANHTGTQSSATISDFTEAVQDAVAALLTSGSNVTLTYDDAANSLTVTAATGGDAEVMRDTIGAALVGVGNVAVTVNDAADTITISTTATVNSTDAALRARSTHTGTQSADTLTDGTTNKAFLATERTKLAGVATGATANDTDANLKNRANHTGSQASATISDLIETVQDLVAAMVVAGTNVTKTYDDTAGTLTISASGSGGGGATYLTSPAEGTASATYATTVTTDADVSTSVFTLTFTVPASGVVEVIQEAYANWSGTSGGYEWTVREAGTVISTVSMHASGSGSDRKLAVQRISGLTPGASKTYTWGFHRIASSTGTHTIYTGGNAGSSGNARMSVRDGAPL